MSFWYRQNPENWALCAHAVSWQRAAGPGADRVMHESVHGMVVLCAILLSQLSFCLIWNEELCITAEDLPLSLWLWKWRWLTLFWCPGNRAWILQSMWLVCLLTVSPEEIVRYSDTQNKLRSTSMGQSKAIILSLESLPLEDPLTSTESCTQNCHHQSLSNGKVNELLMPTPFGFHAASDRTFRDGHSHQNRVRCVSSPCLASGSRVQALNNPTLSADAGKPHAHGTTTPRQSSNGAKNSQTSTDSSKQSSDNVETASPLLEGPVHKDGGYGWIIVLGAFIVSLIIDGVSLSFGIFYPELLTYFGQGQSKTAWAGSVLSGTYSLLGELNCFRRKNRNEKGLIFFFFGPLCLNLSNFVVVLEFIRCVTGVHETLWSVRKEKPSLC